MLRSRPEQRSRTTAETTIIEPRREGVGPRLKEVWRYRDLLPYFGGRARDKIVARTILGKPWLVVRPLVDIGVKALVFGLLLNVSSGPVPYLLFFIAGMTAWRWFDYGLLWVTRSIELNRKLVTKLYFPRLLLPIASISPALIDLCVCLLLLALALGGYAVFDANYLPLDLRLLLIPLALLLCYAQIMAIGLWTSVLGATTRDTRFTLRYVTDVWFYLTPVLYPISLLPATLQTVAQFNPMTTVVEMFKLGALGEGDVRLLGLLVLVTVIGVVGTFGLRFFARAESDAVDRM